MSKTERKSKRIMVPLSAEKSDEVKKLAKGVPGLTQGEIVDLMQDRLADLDLKEMVEIYVLNKMRAAGLNVDRGSAVQIDEPDR